MATMLPMVIDGRTISSERDCQLNVYNFEQMKAQAPSKFGAIRFDPNNNCNLRCVYCHNHRSAEVISTEDFCTFLHHNVISTRIFQVGCVMEPTLDPRLTNLLLAIAASPAKPEALLILQTNGTLLHRHDYGKMKEAGLNQLQVSLDTADPAMQRSLRDGMSLQKVLRNIAGFRRACPKVDLVLVATVTAENAKSMETMIALGLDLGAKAFVLREVFYHPESDVVDHNRMPDLLLKAGEFSAMQETLLRQFGTSGARLIFADRRALDESTDRMPADSV